MTTPTTGLHREAVRKEAWDGPAFPWERPAVDRMRAGVER